MRPVRQRLQPAFLVARQPHIDGVAMHPELLRDLGHTQPVTQNRHHGVVTLFHLAQLQQHPGHLPTSLHAG